MDVNMHLDRRADAIAETVSDGDDLLNTAQIAKLLGVSTQWVEIGRTRGYGPPFIRIGQRGIRYRRDALRSWLKERAEYRSTREYGGEAAA
jgi:predicted DNA-binding transcriptional regulator AlpA